MALATDARRTPRPTNRRTRVAGSLLLDLAAALSVTAFLAAIAAPTLRGQWQERQDSAAVQAFLGDLQFAQAEAARRGQRVAICTGAQGQCDGRNAWATGRVVFLDLDGNGTLDAGEPVLRTSPGHVAPAAASIPAPEPATLFSTSGRVGLAFGADGRLDAQVGAVQTWSLNSVGSERVRCIQLNNAGHTIVRAATGTCA